MLLLVVCSSPSVICNGRYWYCQPSDIRKWLMDHFLIHEPL